MYPMTDLDKQIAKYGAEAVLKKRKKQNSLPTTNTLTDPREQPQEDTDRND
tara:strand:- start:522 stop:674 length:153 start_codon:yes stop_codon:yes gene_type:complete